MFFRKKNPDTERYYTYPGIGGPKGRKRRDKVLFIWCLAAWILTTAIIAVILFFSRK